MQTIGHVLNVILTHTNIIQLTTVVLTLSKRLHGNTLH